MIVVFPLPTDLGFSEYILPVCLSLLSPWPSGMCTRSWPQNGEGMDLALGVLGVTVGQMRGFLGEVFTAAYV